MRKTLLGIEIGGTKLQLALGDENAQILARYQLVVDPDAGAAGIRQQLETTLAEILETTRPAAAGVGFGGPVDWKTGAICRSHQIEGWSGFSLGEWLAKIIGAPVSVDNDANVAALGEACRGAGMGADPVFYVTLGSGVGGGLATGGRIYHGAPPGESEIGHIRLDRSGTIVESRCSGWAVDARIRALKTECPSSILNRLTICDTRGEARHLAAALAQNDAAARRILTETAEDLAFGLSHVTHLFHPRMIIIGGGLAKIGEPLRAAVAEALPKFLMEVFAPGPAIRLAELAEDAVPTGALILASGV